MTAAILCPGPSLTRTWDAGAALDYDCVVAVNRAALAFPCDYWAVLDSPLLQQLSTHVVQGDPLLLTREAYRPKFSTRPGPTVESLTCPVRQWDLFTATAALVLAGGRSTSVDVYGADWTPDAPDFDGVNLAERRTAERFEKEREIWGAVTAWLGERGVKVTRTRADSDQLEQTQAPTP